MGDMKRAANLSVDAELLEEAKALNIDLSQTLEKALRTRVREAHGTRWRDENRAALKSYTDYIDRHSVWSDGLRSF